MPSELERLLVAEKLRKLHEKVFSLLRQRKSNAAFPLIEEAFDSVKKTFEPSHRLYRKTLSLLASTHMMADKDAKGIKLLEELISISPRFEMMDDEEKLDHASDLNNLAVSLGRLQEFNRALPHYKRSVELKQFIHGEFNVKIIETLQGLIICCDESGQFAKAEPWLKLMLSVIERELGRKSPEFYETLRNLQQWYEASGKSDMADTIEKQYFGKEESSLEKKIQLAKALYDQHKFEEAGHLHREIIDITKMPIPFPPEVLNEVGMEP